MRQLLTMILVVGLLLSFAGPAAAVITPTLDYQASLDDGLNDVWEDLNGSTTHDWVLSGAAHTAVAGPTAFDISHAYTFSGMKGNTEDFNSVTGNPTDASASFEMLFKPDTPLGDGMLMETGGNGSGTAIYFESGILKMKSRNGSKAKSATGTFDLSTLSAGELGDFIHLVAAFDRAADTVTLYVNGQAGTPVAAGANMTDWGGTDNSGLAGVTGTAAVTPNDGETVPGNFLGQISLLRLYESNLAQADATDLYTILTTIPEPTLTWDEAGDAEWADLTGGTDSHWDGDQPDSVPGPLTPTFIRTNVVSVDGARTALNLTIESGGLNVLGTGLLDLAEGLSVTTGTLDIADGGGIGLLTDVDLAPGTTATIHGGLLAGGNVNLAGTTTIGPTGELEGDNVTLAVGSTTNLSGTLSAVSGLTLNTSLDASGGTLATDTAAVSVPGGVTLTYDKALAVGGLDLEGTVDLSTAVDKTVTVNGGTMRLPQAATLTGVETIALSGGTLNISRIAAPGAAPAAAPLAHWAFNDGSGDTAQDTTVVHDGSLAGFPTDDSQWVDGVIGGALLFDGINDQVDIGGYTGVLGSTPRTISAWIKTSDGDSSIINWGNNSAGEKWTFYVEANGRLRAEVNGGYRRGTTDLRDGEWHHVAVTLPDDGDVNTEDLLFYVDGKLEAQSGLTAHAINTTLGVEVRIGRDFDSTGRHFDGAMDDLRLYSEALSAGDVAGMAGSEVPRDMSSMNLSISGASAVNAFSAGETIFAGAELLDGSTLTLGGPGSYNLTALTLPAGPATATLDALATTMPGPITANGGTLIKTGAGDLILDADAGGLAGATLIAGGGRLVSVRGATSPLGTADVQIGDGELLLAASGATATYSNAITATGIGTLTVGAGGAAGAVPGVAVTLDGATGLTLDPASELTVRTTDGYTVDLAGNIAGTGNLIVPNGATLNVTGAASAVGVGGVDIAGSLVLDPAVADKTVAVNGGAMYLRSSGTLTGVEIVSLSTGTLSVSHRLNPGAVQGSPVAGWKFDETMGLKADNAVTPGTNDGDLLFFPGDDPQWVDGVVGGALRFDGFNGQVDAGAAALTNYTVSLWVKADSLAQNHANQSAFASTQGGTGFQLDFSNVNAGAYRYNGGPNINFGPVTTDWVHLAVSYDGATVKTYYNGQPATSADLALLDAREFSKYFIGRNRNGDRKFPGTIDDVYVYETALDDATIAAIFGTPTAPDTASLNLLAEDVSSLESNYAGETAFASLSLADAATLTLSSPGTFDFGTTTIVSGTATIDMPVAATLGPIAANGGTLVKTGAADLILDADSSGLAGATLAVNGGRMVSVQDATSPLGSAAVQIGNGELLLAAAGATAVYDNPITATGNGTLTIGAGGVAGTSAAAAVTLGSAANGLTVDAGATLSVEIEPGYTLDVAGNTVVSGTLTLGSQSITGMTNVALTGGTLDLKGAVLTPSPAIAAGPVAHWKFDDGTGPSTLNDVNPLALIGTQVNFPIDDSQWIAGIDGGALQFDANDGVDGDFVQITGYTGIPGSGPRTMSAWVKVPPEATDEEILSWGTDVAGQKWIFRVQVGNGQVGAIRTEVNGGYRVGTTDIRDNQWHHVVAVLPEGVTDVSGIQLYVDGQYDGQSAVQGRAINTATGAYVKIGNGHANHFFDGAIDDVVLYDRGLTATEVAGMFGAIEVTDTSGMNVSVDGDSTINSSATGNTGFASLTLESGALTTTGPGTFSFGSTSIDAAAMATGFGGDRDVDLGSVDGGGSAATITKSGTGNVALSGAITGLQDASVNVDGGGMSLAADMTVANLSVAAGTVMNTGASSAIVGDTLRLGSVPIRVSAGKTIAATGANLTTAADLTVDGGIVTIGSNDVATTAGLVAHWNFDDGTGPVANNDLTDDGTNDGTLTAFPIDDTQWVAGTIGGALHFDGVDDFVDAGTTDLTGAYTIAMWVKADSLVQASQWDSPFTSAANTNSGGTGGGFQIDVASATDGTYQWVGGPVTAMGPVIDDWAHIAATYDGTTLRTFYNGQPANSVDTDNGMTFNQFLFGRNRSDDRRFAGTLDEAYAYDRAIEADDVAALYEMGVFGAGQTIDLSTNNVNVTADTEIASSAGAVTLGNLSVQPGVTGMTFSGADFAVADATIADGVTVDGQWEVGGTLSIGNSVGTMTVGNGGLVFGPAATYNAEVNLGDGAAEPDADAIVITIAGAIHLDGTLAPAGVGRTNGDFFSASTTVTVIDNTAGGFLDGVVHDSGTNPTLYEFAAVDPAPADDATAHVGQGAFLRAVNYVQPVPNVTDAVDLELFIALGGDADGDKKVWLSDWAALRSNFGNTGTGKTWIDGNFDPWVDEKVWLSDWAALRANFGNVDYTVGGAAAVPEPGTIAMLLAGLAGLAAFGWRRRRAG